MKAAIVLIVALAVAASAGGSMLIMPGRSYKGALPPLTPEETTLRDQLRRQVLALAGRIGERNTFKYRSLREAEEYVREQLKGLGLPLREESYRLQEKGLQDKDMVNLEVEIKGSSRPEEIVVVGAHYDSAPGAPGANDNASGVAALLELARLLKEDRPARTVRFVAFVNEEPPYFQNETMGSLVYARRAKKRGDKIVAMLSLETIGYYSDEAKSQQYPAPFARFYPDTANFIAFVGDIGSGPLLRRAIGSFRKHTRFPSEGIAAPGSIMGMGWSDHWSFWQEGYRAIMITDTALFRYPYYHDGADTPDKLDYDKMARVVGGIVHVVRDLASR